MFSASEHGITRGARLERYHQIPRPHSSTVMLTIDLVNDVFEPAFADAGGRIVERKRLRQAVIAVSPMYRSPQAGHAG